jgi:hypothetical protein
MIALGSKAAIGTHHWKVIIEFYNQYSRIADRPERTKAAQTFRLSHPTSSLGGYRIFVPDTQHALSEAAGMTLFKQHRAFGLITAGLTYFQAAHLISALRGLAVLNVIGYAR